MFQIPDAIEMTFRYNERQASLKDEQRQKITETIGQVADLGFVRVDVMPNWLKDELEAKGYEVTETPAIAINGPKQDKIDWRNSGLMLDLSLDNDDE
jgi:hypothetical protein